jgi:hypothetical protein
MRMHVHVNAPGAEDAGEETAGLSQKLLADGLSRAAIPRVTGFGCLRRTAGQPTAHNRRNDPAPHLVAETRFELATYGL